MQIESVTLFTEGEENPRGTVIKVTGARHDGTGLFANGVFEIIHITEEGFEILFRDLEENWVASTGEKGLHEKYTYEFQDISGNGIDEIVKTGQKCTLRLGNDGRFLDTNCAVVKDIFVYVDAQYRPSKPPTTYQNDVLGVQVADTMGLRIVEDGRIANDSTWGFSLVKSENGGNGALVMSIALVDQAPPDVNQAVTKFVAAYPDLPIQQTEIMVDGRPGKMLFPLPGPNGATYIYLATNQQLYRVIYAADTLDAMEQALLAQLHFVKPTRTLAALGLKRAVDEPIQVTAPADQALPKGQAISQSYSSTATGIPLVQWPLYRHEQLGVEFRYPPELTPYDETSAFVRFTDTDHAARPEEAFNVVNGGFPIGAVSEFVEQIGLAIVMTETFQIDGQSALYMQLEEQNTRGYQSVVGILTPDQRTITMGNRTVDSAILRQILCTIHFFSPTISP